MNTLYRILFILSLIIYHTGYSQSQCWFDELIKDFDKRPKEFKEFMNSDQYAMYAYEQLYKANKKGLKQDIPSLKIYSKCIQNPKLKQLGITDELLAKIQGAEGVSYEQVLNNLDLFANNMAKNKVTLNDFNKVLNQLTTQQVNKRDGANWIVEYLGKNADQFKGKNIKFEEFNDTDLGGRFVDVTDISNQSRKIFYEFKSVKDVPPARFNEQFMKDLTNANNLDQIKWIFNGSKKPANFKQNMLEAIDKLPLKDGTSLTDNLVKKFGVKNSDELINLIESKFENIFKLVQK